MSEIKVIIPEEMGTYSNGEHGVLLEVGENTYKLPAEALWALHRYAQNILDFDDVDEYLYSSEDLDIYDIPVEKLRESAAEVLPFYQRLKYDCDAGWLDRMVMALEMYAREEKSRNPES